LNEDIYKISRFDGICIALQAGGTAQVIDPQAFHRQTAGNATILQYCS